MKPNKVFIVTRAASIEFVSSNRKAAYESLKDSLRTIEQKDLISYSQMTRRLIKENKYVFSSKFGFFASIEVFKVHTSYKVELMLCS